jgi:hypothetical protein
MNLPVYERIVKELRRRLQPVAPDMADSVGLAEVVRPGQIISNLASIVIQQQAIRPTPQLDHSGNPPAIAFTLFLSVNCFVENKFDSEFEYSVACNQVASNIMAAITNPDDSPELWYRFDENAINATFGQVVELQTEIGVTSGIKIPLQILFRVSETDHTVSRA